MLVNGDPVFRLREHRSEWKDTSLMNGRLKNKYFYDNILEHALLLNTTPLVLHNFEYDIELGWFRPLYDYSLIWPTKHIISHEICPRFCCALLCCGYIISALCIHACTHRISGNRCHMMTILISSLFSFFPSVRRRDSHESIQLLYRKVTPVLTWFNLYPNMDEWWHPL